MIVPVCAIALVLSLLMLQLRPRRNNLGDQLRRIDWLGFFLFTGSLIGILVPITQVCLTCICFPD